MYHIESVPPKLHLLTKTSVVQCNVVLQVVMCGFAAKLKKYVLYMQCPKLSWSQFWNQDLDVFVRGMERTLTELWVTAGRGAVHMQEGRADGNCVNFDKNKCQVPVQGWQAHAALQAWNRPAGAQVL